MGFEKDKQKFLEQNFSGITPQSIKGAIYKGKRKTTWRIRYLIKGHDPNSRKTITLKDTKENFDLESDYQQRLLELKAYSKGLEKKIDMKSNSKELVSIQECYNQMLKEKENEFLLLGKTEKEIKNNNQVKHIKNGGYLLKKFLSEKGIEKWDSLQKDFEIMAQYRYWLLEQPVRGASNRKGETLSFKTIKERLAFVRDLVKFSRGRGINSRTLEEVRAFTLEEQAYVSNRGNRRLKVRRDIEREEVLAIYENLPTHWKLPFLTVVTLGARKNEICTLMEDEIDLERNIITKKGFERVPYKGEIIAVCTKNRKPYTYPIPVELKTLFRSHMKWRKKWIENNHHTPFIFFVTEGNTSGLPKQNNFDRALKQACKMTQIDPREIDIHSGRVTKTVKVTELISNFIENSSQMASEFLGHSGKVNKNHYFRLKENMLPAIIHEANKYSFGVDQNHFDILMNGLNHSGS